MNVNPRQHFQKLATCSQITYAMQTIQVLQDTTVIKECNFM